MDVQNLKLFQNPAIYCKYHYGNDVIIPAELFSGRVRTLIAEFMRFTVKFPK